MSISRFAITSAFLFAGGSLHQAQAQSVVVDQGTFAVEIDGAAAGTEDFSIRRAGFNRTAVFIATGVVTLSGESGPAEARPLLRATGEAGLTEAYELSLVGDSPIEITMNLAPPRFVSRFESSAGQEEREFRARTGTRIIETMVAHHLYFVRDVAVGDSVPVIEPRERREGFLLVTASEDDELRLGRNRVSARKVTFSVGEEERRVWYDRQGRVVRVEIPSRSYVAQRRDLVG